MKVSIFLAALAMSASCLAAENGVKTPSALTVDCQPSLGCFRKVKSDLNGDGKSDILWRNSSTGSNYVYWMDGLSLAGGWQYPFVTDPNWKIVGIGNLTTFGTNILWQNSVTGANYLWNIDGETENGSEVPVILPTDRNRKVIGIGYFYGYGFGLSGAGTGEILCRHSITGSNSIHVWGSTRIGLRVSGQVNVVSDQTWQIAGFADFDGDGRDDILWRNSVTGSNYIYLMSGLTITSAGEVNLIADQNWQIAGVGDFDGDGRSDILWRNAVTGDNYIYLMNGIAIKAAGQVNTVTDPNWKIVATGDYDGDGKSDILWRNSFTGSNYIYLMNGFSITALGEVNNVADQNWKVYY